MVDKKDLRALIEGRLDWNETKSIISGYKDKDRFEKYLEILQEKVTWQETLLLPLSDRLFIVQKDEERIVKCICGYEFGDYRENWKLKTLIHVRDQKEEIEQLYPYPGKPDLQYCEIREFTCPGCGSLLNVEAVPFGYPVIMDVLPDIDTFYNDWLGKPLKSMKEFRDMSHGLTGKWVDK
jgi:acetone carboxylase, gamma subunit